MGYIKRNNLKQSLHTLINSYKYKEAISLYHGYKRTFKDGVVIDVLPLLEHAQLRLGLDYDGALQKSRKVGSINLSSIFTDKVLRKLHEFLMLMEVRLKQGQIEDFILKTTPFMYELMRYYFTKEFHVNWRQVEKKTSMGISLDMVAFESQYPKLYTSWKSNTNKPYRQELQLSFYHMLHMLEDQDTVDTSLLKQLKEIRRIEKKIRNKMAHEVVVFTEQDICSAADIQSLQSFLHQIKDVFFIITGQEKQNKLIYDTINTYVLEQIQ